MCMIHFKNKHGFTLIEVVVAIAILGFIMVPIFSLLGNVMRSSSRAVTQLERFKQADLLLYQTMKLPREERKSVPEKIIANPPTTLQYSARDCSGNGALEDFEHITCEKIGMRWRDGKKEKTDALFMLRFNPPEKKQ